MQLILLQLCRYMRNFMLFIIIGKQSIKLHVSLNAGKKHREKLFRAMSFASPTEVVQTGSDEWRHESRSPAARSGQQRGSRNGRDNSITDRSAERWYDMHGGYAIREIDSKDHVGKPWINGSYRDGNRVQSVFKKKFYWVFIAYTGGARDAGKWAQLINCKKKNIICMQWIIQTVEL